MPKISPDRIQEQFAPKYNSVFNLHTRSKEVVDEIASKLEKITNLPVIDTTGNSKSEDKVAINNATIINENGIADIIDAFVNMRSAATLDTIEDSSLSRVLITLNELVNINFHRRHQDAVFEEQEFVPTQPVFMERAYQVQPQAEGAVVYQSAGAPSAIYSSTSPSSGASYDPMMDAVRKNLLGEGEKEKNRGGY